MPAGSLGEGLSVQECAVTLWKNMFFKGLVQQIDYGMFICVSMLYMDMYFVCVFKVFM